jgi:GNAT superfamily N-acetyltransferase
VVKLERDEYSITDDVSRLDIDAIFTLLRATYWAASRTRDQIAASIGRSICVGLFHKERQVGFARAVTDQTTFTWLCDVVVHPDHRGKGLGRWMLESILKLPSVVPTRIILVTKDAQAFYSEYGFEPHPYHCMIKRPDETA